MSYDADIIKIHKEVSLENTDLKFQVQTVEASYNYTSNVYEMLQACMESLKEKGLIPPYSTHWTEAITEGFNNKSITLFILELKANKEYYEKFNPRNGWGTYNGVIDWLTEMEKYQNKDYKIQINW